jgi:hypothetical protein
MQLPASLLNNVCTAIPLPEKGVETAKQQEAGITIAKLLSSCSI